MKNESDNAANLSQSISERFKNSKIYKCQFRDNTSMPLDIRFFAFSKNANSRQNGCDNKESICVTSSKKVFTDKYFPDSVGKIEGIYLVEWSPVKAEGNNYSWNVESGPKNKEFQFETNTNTLYYKFDKVDKFSCVVVK